MSKSLLATLLVAVSVLVTSSSAQVNAPRNHWCGRFCMTSKFGNCQSVCSSTTLSMTCYVKGCKQTCFVEGCSLKCHGESCKQICPQGNCQLNCPKGAIMCDQDCGQFNNCKKEYLQPPTTEATTTEAPTTEAPTTEAPTTEAPTTEAPTTEAPTTEAQFPDECNDVLWDGVCYQSCTGEGCTMECFNSEHYHSCYQECNGGNCNMTCSAPLACAFGCPEGNCKKVICKADANICEQSCYGGGCGMECHGNSCEQICDGGGCGMECYGNSCDQHCSQGNCHLQCPSDDGVPCAQSCGTNCTVEFV